MSFHEEWVTARRGIERDEMYQLDAIVSLFAMILLILVTTAVASGMGIAQWRIRTTTMEPPPFRLSSIDAPFPRLETWLLHEGALLKLDYDRIALALLEGSSLEANITDPDTGIDIFFEGSLSEIGAYDRLTINLPSSPIQEVGGVVGDIISLTDKEALAGWTFQTRPARLIAWRTGQEHIAAVLSAADLAGRPVTLSLRSGDGRFVARRNAASFSFQGILRTF